MSDYILTSAEMRAAEEAAECGLSELMERAGAAVAEAVWRFGGGRPCLIICGPGNNGGDGYIAARLLHERGLDVRVAALREPRAALAIAARAAWKGPVEALDAAQPAPILVDALFGTGLARPLEAEITAPLARLCAKAEFVIAVDLPSGVGTDDGAVMGAKQADLTLALGARKPAHLLHPSAGLCGAVRVADLGLHVTSKAQMIVRPTLAMPETDSHKYRRGYVAVIGGAMGGAAMLSAKAAMRLAGYVALVGAKRTGPDALVYRRWENVPDDRRIGALLIGPGLGRDQKARDGLAAALQCPYPLVLDADALMLLDVASIKARAAPVILTPHAGEFAHLFGEGQGSKIERARHAATSFGATIIFKGADTVIAEPTGKVVVSSQAPSWLASAGTGDVLAGMVAALLSGGMAPFDAANAAVWLHGEAARRAGPCLIADDLPNHIPAAIAACL